MTPPVELIASYFTLAGNVVPLTGDMVSPHDLRTRAEAAARAGFAGIGLVTADLAHNLERYGVDGIRAILDDNGLRYLEFEVLLDWFADGERRAASDADRAFLLDAAQKLGAYQVKVGGDITGDTWPVERMAESFATLAREARDAGTQVSLEIFPASNVRDLPTAIAITEGAGENAGLLLDIWHLTRGNIPYDDIATIPQGLIKHIELDDAAATLEGTIMEDTLERRRMPGEGDFDVQHFLRAVRAAGYGGVYGVEVLSAEIRAMPVAEAARRAYDTTMGEFAKLDAGAQA